MNGRMAGPGQIVSVVHSAQARATFLVSFEPQKWQCKI